MATAAEMTEKQRLAVEALDAARREGQTLRAYAHSRGLVIQDLYNAIAVLWRRGLLAKPTRSSRRNFVAVRIEPGPSPATVAGRLSSGGVLCRIVHSKGYLIECTQWPPANWLESLTMNSTDAAT